MNGYNGDVGHCEAQGSLAIKSYTLKWIHFCLATEEAGMLIKPHINTTTDQWDCEQSEGIVDGLAGFPELESETELRGDWEAFGRANCHYRYERTSASIVVRV